MFSQNKRLYSFFAHCLSVNVHTKQQTFPQQTKDIRTEALFAPKLHDTFHHKPQLVSPLDRDMRNQKTQRNIIAMRKLRALPHRTNTESSHNNTLPTPAKPTLAMVGNHTRGDDAPNKNTTSRGARASFAGLPSLTQENGASDTQQVHGGVLALPKIRQTAVSRPREFEPLQRQLLRERQHSSLKVASEGCTRATRKHVQIEIQRPVPSA